MPRYPLQGISALSQLTIDADKDWQTRGITNLKELAAAMAFGDLVARGPAGILVRIPAGPAGMFLTGAGAALPYWGPGGLYLNRYLPATLALNLAAGKVTVDHSHNEPAPFASVHVEDYQDGEPNLYNLLSTLILADAENLIAAAAHAHNENAPFASSCELLVDGFVEETAAAVQTDHTAQARSGAAGDLNLCPMVPTVLDKIYIGSLRPFSQVWMNYSQAGVGNWTNSCYYWNGAWTGVVGEDDETSSFTNAAGIRRIQHTPQGDWALSIIQGMNLYWMMIRTDNFVNQVTKPLGSQIFLSIE